MTDELPPCKCGAPAMPIVYGRRYRVRCSRPDWFRELDAHYLGNPRSTPEKAAEEWRRMQEQSDE